MGRTVRATYVDGDLRPSEPLDLEEGAEVTLSVVAAEQPGTAEPVEPASSIANEADSYERSGTAFLEWIDQLNAAVPSEVWDDIPTDLVMNKKHYLYGHPKVEDD